MSRSQSAIGDAHKREERNEAALGPCNSDRSHNPGISSARSFRRPPRFASGPRISAAAPRFAWRYEGTGACVLCCCLSPRFCFFFFCCCWSLVSNWGGRRIRCSAGLLFSLQGMTAIKHVFTVNVGPCIIQEGVQTATLCCGP